MTMYPFEIGGKYRNRNGDYEVMAFDGERMKIRYDDGSEQTVKMAIQFRIWQNIEAEIAPPSRFLGDDSLDTYPIQELVQVVLKTIPKPYPEDLIDEVFRAIEADPEWLSRYYSLREHFSSHGKNGRLTVNSSIGWYTKDLTGLASKAFDNSPKSKLITGYTRLTYDKS